jgi:DNA-binding HxlR family transcriptional regulator
MHPLTFDLKEGTQKFYTYHLESVMPPTVRPPAPHDPDAGDPALDALVRDLIGRVADKWTMILLELLAEHGTLRFGQLATHCEGISQKMLTQTLRHMERDGLLTRTVYPVVPPKVEYHRTELGETLGAAFCAVWEWAERHRAQVEAARATFDARPT